MINPILRFRIFLAIEVLEKGLLKDVPTNLIKKLDVESCDSLMMGLLATHNTSKEKQ